MIVNDVGRVASTAPLLCTLPANFNHHSDSRRNGLITHPTPPPSQQPSRLPSPTTALPSYLPTTALCLRSTSAKSQSGKGLMRERGSTRSGRYRRKVDRSLQGKRRVLQPSDCTPGGRLAVPDTVSDAELAVRLLPRRYATEYFIYGKDKYWRGDDMVNRTTKVAIPIFNATFPSCQAVFAFDNVSNHCPCAADALRVENMNLHPGGKRGMLREAFMHGKGLPLSMSFAKDHYSRELAVKPNGIKRVLKERGLWPERGLVLECPTTHNRPGCNPEGGCCARRVLEAERDFRDQKGRLQEEVEALGYRILFYPKFHCELNFIERYWCQAK